MIIKCLCVGCGGFLGATARYLLGMALASRLVVPAPTLIINIVGCIVMGVIVESLAKAEASNIYLFLTLGLCGGFTTFSTFSMETVRLFEDGRYMIGLGYMLSSVVFCFLGILGGRLITKP